LEGIPGGLYENLETRSFDREMNREWNDFEYRFISKKTSPAFELPKQELFVRVEAPKGELGIFLIGDQSSFPWRPGRFRDAPNNQRMASAFPCVDPISMGRTGSFPPPFRPTFWS